MNVSFLIGVFVSSYLQNPKFRNDIDNILKDAAGKGIDLLNMKPYKNNEGDANDTKSTGQSNSVVAESVGQYYNTGINLQTCGNQLE